MAETGIFRPIRQVDPNAPRYVEAYPRFNSLNAEKAIRRGATICEFMEDGRLVGRYEFRKYLDDVKRPRWILGNHEILGSRYIRSDSGDASFPTKVNLTNEEFTRFFVICPICVKPKAILAFTRWWACRTCHKLLHLSQVMDPVARRYEEYLDLVTEVRKGRQKGQHSITFLRLKERKKELARWLTGKRLVIRSGEQNQVIEARWVRPDEAMVY